MGGFVLRFSKGVFGLIFCYCAYVQLIFCMAEILMEQTFWITLSTERKKCLSSFFFTNILDGNIFVDHFQCLVGCRSR